jgi:AIPR protein
VRIIEVPLTSPMAPTITYRSNNQNAVKARDQKSNSPIQMRLQQEVADFRTGAYALAIKGGEKPVAQTVIDNELAGKMLLSFDLLRPWSAHQAYRIFDESFNEIFARPIVTGKRIILLYEIMTIIVDELEKLENRLFAHYSLTRFLVLYMVARVLQRDAIGKRFSGTWTRSMTHLMG